MSTLYVEAASCARRIIDVVGPCNVNQSRLALSGRFPYLPIAPVHDLLPSSIYDKLDKGTLSRVEIVLDRRLSAQRDHLNRKYRDLAEQLYSPGVSELPDVEVETCLVKLFESQYMRFIDSLRHAMLKILPIATCKINDRNTRGGFGNRTLLILETAFSHTKSPLATEIEHLSHLTSLEPHQVRTWFQNKRNRGNKVGKKTTLRIASASHVQSATQLPIIDGRRVASLPSRKYAPGPTPAGRVTRGLPRRNGNGNLNAPQTQEVPLSRTLSQESRGSFGSDETTFSYSSAPSNGGFTGFTYPSIPLHPSHIAAQQPQPTYNLDPLINSTYGSPSAAPPFQYGPPSFQQEPQPPFDGNMVVPQAQQPVDQYPYNQSDFNTQPYPTQGAQQPPQPNHLNHTYAQPQSQSQSQSQFQSEIDFESYLNLNIDNLAPPTDTLGYDFEAQVQAALRSDPGLYNTTLAPTLSPSLSPLSNLSEEWFNDFDFTSMGDVDGEGMELLKVVLDGMSRSGSSVSMDSPIEKTELDPGMGASGNGARSDSPETVASFTLHSEGVGSGRQSPAGPSTISTSNLESTSNSVTGEVDEGTFSFMLDLDSMDYTGGTGTGTGSVGGDGSGSGSGWMTGVLPFDMGDQVMGTA